MAPLAQNLVGFTAFLLVVMAVRQPTARWAGAKWAYMLWLLPAAWLVSPLPPLGTAAPISYGFTVGPAAQELAFAAFQEQSWSSGPILLLLAWAAGASAFAAWQWLSYARFVASLEVAQPSPGFSSFGGLRVEESAAVNGPVAVGFIARRIVVPLHFAQTYNTQEQILALTHELVHHRRGDLWWNAAALGLLALNWFNPVAWLAYRAFRVDQELACDAAVACKVPSQRLHYANALLKSASSCGNPVAACPLERTTDLKRRLKMLKHHRASLGRNLLGVSAIAAVGLTGVSLAGPGVAAAQPELVVVERSRDGSVVMAPRPHKVMKRLPGNQVIAGPGTPNCDKAEDRFEIELGAGPTAKDRLWFSVCNNGETRADMVATLEEARQHITRDSHMPTPHREKIVPILEAEIARRKAAL